MGPSEKREYLDAIRARYHRAGKAEKKTILDEFCLICEYNRKYAIRILKAVSPKVHPLHREHPGRPRTYHDPVIITVLEKIWHLMNLPCSKRLKAALPLWLPYYEEHYKVLLHPRQTKLLMQISASTIDRLLKRRRASTHKWGLSTTKPGSLLKRHIPIATDQWDESRPGYLEADTVAHCGTSTDGTYVITINCIDMATTWREQRAVYGKGELGVLHALEDIEKRLPFKIRGFDCDNGSEFLNWHILKYFTHRKRPVKFTRSRPYQKNDNAHVEEKNWTLVRQYIGYQRMATPDLAEELNELYTSEWRLMMNFFLPSTKLLEKRRDGEHLIKRYDTPKTPYQRVMEHPLIAPKTKRELTQLFESLNPFVLQHEVEIKIKHITKQAEPLPRYIRKQPVEK
ncbi:MAG: integrase [Acidobacteriota bacterium]